MRSRVATHFDFAPSDSGARAGLFRPGRRLTGTAQRRRWPGGECRAQPLRLRSGTGSPPRADHARSGGAQRGGLPRRRLRGADTDHATCWAVRRREVGPAVLHHVVPADLAEPPPGQLPVPRAAVVAAGPPAVQLPDAPAGRRRLWASLRPLINRARPKCSTCRPSRRWGRRWPSSRRRRLGRLQPAGHPAGRRTGPRTFTSPATGSSTSPSGWGRPRAGASSWSRGRRRSASASAACPTATPRRRARSSRSAGGQRPAGRAADRLGSWPTRVPPTGCSSPSRCRTSGSFLAVRG